MIGLIIVGPLYLSENLEEIETADSNLKTRHEIISSSNTNITYSPYVEFNDNNDQIYYNGIYFPGVHIYDKGEGSPVEVGSISYNVDGYKDLIMTGGAYPEGGTRVYIEMNNCSASDFIVNSIDEISIFVDCSLTYDIDLFGWRDFDADYTHNGRNTISEPSSWNDDRSGASYFNMTLSEAQLNAGASHQGTSPYKTLQIGLRFPGGITGDVPVYVDFQVNPGYFQQEITTYDNQTITHYDPYIISRGSTYQVHKVCMGLGAVVIGVVGWIASPWGEVLDNFLPINSINNGGAKNRK